VKGRNNNFGIILLPVLWILAILSLLALSLGRSAGMEISLAEYRIAKVKAYAAARAGIAYALNLLENSPSSVDTLFSCGIKISDGKSLEEYFKNINVGEGAHFDISFTAKDDEGQRPVKRYGLSAETGRINLNAINGTNFRVLSVFMQNVGVERITADNIAAAVADWHDEDDTAVDSDGVQGAENEYYGSLPVVYKTKNRPFDATEELLLVKDMTTEIYKKIKDDVTIFPRVPSAGLQININTASLSVVNAVLTQAGESVNVQELMPAVSQSRRGHDGQIFTFDDGKLNAALESPVGQAYTLAAQTANHLQKSSFYRIRSVGVEKRSRTRVTVEALVGYDEINARWTVRAWDRQ